MKDLYALKDPPTHVSQVSIPKGEKLTVGIADAHGKLGRGGGIQYQLSKRFKKSWFTKAGEINSGTKGSE